MLVIGLTGSLGSGKSTVASLLAQQGAKVFNADRIVHQEMRHGGQCHQSVVKIFSRSILTGGQIDRKKLAHIVFKDRKKLRQLEKIMHPVVKKKMMEVISIYKKKLKSVVIVFDVPLLFESGLDSIVDQTIVVKANLKQQIQRTTMKLKITKAEALRRIRAQWPLKRKIRLADLIIDNSGALNQTKRQVKKSWEIILQRKKR